MASGLRSGTAWYGMRPPVTDDGTEGKNTDKSDENRRRSVGVRAQRQRHYQSGTARIVGPA